MPELARVVGEIIVRSIRWTSIAALAAITIKKAKLANVFKWKLKELGYSASFVDRATTEIATRLAVTTARSASECSIRYRISSCR